MDFSHWCCSQERSLLYIGVVPLYLWLGLAFAARISLKAVRGGVEPTGSLHLLYKYRHGDRIFVTKSSLDFLKGSPSCSLKGSPLTFLKGCSVLGTLREYHEPEFQMRTETWES